MECRPEILSAFGDASEKQLIAQQINLIEKNRNDSLVYFSEEMY